MERERVVETIGENVDDINYDSDTEPSDLDNKNNFDGPQSERTKNVSESSTKETDDLFMKRGFLDVLDSQQLYKKTIRSGGNELKKPVLGQRATVRMRTFIANEQGEPVEEVENLPNLSFYVGQSDVLMAVDVCVQMMSLDEVCEIIAFPRFGYGFLGREPDIPSNSILNIQLELLRLEPGPNVAEMSVEDRIQLGEEKKSRGNYYFQRSEFDQAISVYRKALDILDVNAHESDTEDDRSKLVEAEAKVYNNLAAAQLKIEAFDAALDSLRYCLRHNPSNVKAMYRQARAYAAKQQYAQAIQALRDALSIEPDSTILRRELHYVRSLANKQNAFNQQLCRRMLGDPAPPNFRRRQQFRHLLRWLKSNQMIMFLLSFLFAVVVVLVWPKLSAYWR